MDSITGIVSVAVIYALVGIGAAIKCKDKTIGFIGPILTGFLWLPVALVAFGAWLYKD